MQSESNRIEYKEILNDKLERSVISFLNSQAGGRLYIGVNDEGVAVGIENIDDTQKRIIDRIKNNIQTNTLGLFDVIVEEYGYCSLIKAMDKILDRMIVENKTFAKITEKQRIEKNLVDKTALREFIINAFAHNDYSNGDTPIFEIFSDRISITSYGGLVEGLSQDEFFECCSRPRNREIMRIFKDLKYVEQLGSGTRRTFKVYDNSIFKFTPNFMFVNFPFNIDELYRELYMEPEKFPINETGQKILDLIRENNRITGSEIADKLNMTRRSITKNMKALKENGIIKRIGSNKSGTWEFTGK
ncbi:MAG: putative DNA binding domain-containing protein [Oscillospiraceae bacterium]|nr:putative DNA binding domain-containing protein [Oscillospiraceae bacterium]